MGLDDFLDDQLDDGGDDETKGRRKYYRMTQEQFEELLESTPAEFYIVGTDQDPNLAFTREIVYATDELGHDDLQLRVYSTIDERTAKARDKGDDAIRNVIWSKSYSKPVSGRKKTLRIETWKKNLSNKILDMLEEWQDLVLECEECGAWMVKRSGKHGEFMGCIKYPVCQNTENITKVREKYGKDV